MKNRFLAFTLFSLVWLSLSLASTAQSNVPFVTVPFDVNNIPEPVPPRKEVRDFFELDPFYQQWIGIEGFPVVASAQVNSYALKEAAWLIYQMIGHRGDILQALAQSRARFTVMAYNEMITEIPEYSSFQPDFYWDKRNRGLGGWVASCGAENLLAYPGDPYWAINVLIHEFAHTVHRIGLDSGFDNRLRTTYDAAIENGLWQGTFAATDRDEYWAELTESWFNSNNRIKTRTALKGYDPGIATLLAEVYGDTQWRYTPPATRTHLPHLQGFNPEDLPTFQWSPELDALYAQLSDPQSDGGGNWVNLSPYDPNQLSRLNASNITGAETAILIVNFTGYDVLVYWVAPDGTETFFARMRDDIRYLSTHVGGLCLVKDTNGTALAVFQAVEKVGRVLITPTLTSRTDIEADVSGDGVVNILDLLVIASEFGSDGQNLAADVNGDRVVDVLDLILVAGMFDGAAAAPSAQPQVPETLTAVEVHGWLTDARSLEVRDPIMKRGFVVLEQLLIALTPKETELLANYPNPFNPETWIPYRLAEDASVTLVIYDTVGHLVRTLNVGHQIAAVYESESNAIYWDGRNDVGEQVASGVYFYTLTVRSETRADDFSATRKMVILK